MGGWSVSREWRGGRGFDGEKVVAHKSWWCGCECGWVYVVGSSKMYRIQLNRIIGTSSHDLTHPVTFRVMFFTVPKPSSTTPCLSQVYSLLPKLPISAHLQRRCFAMCNGWNGWNECNGAAEAGRRRQRAHRAMMKVVVTTMMYAGKVTCDASRR